MTDSTLLMFGAAVSFIAAGGAYIYIRERFTAREPAVKAITEQSRREVALRRARSAA